MADEITHKLITPTQRTGYLNDTILCWNILGAPSPDQIRHTKYTTNINEATCDDCLRIWKSGVYYGHGG